LGCGTCTKSCPQELKVKDYMAAAMRGDIARVADLSFDCIMCGMCVSRCPAEEAQRTSPSCAGGCMAVTWPQGPAPGSARAEIDAGKHDEALAKMKAMPDAELRQAYNTRDIEPE